VGQRSKTVRVHSTCKSPHDPLRLVIGLVKYIAALGDSATSGPLAAPFWIPC
jgi:hypothetical protein